MSAAVPRRRRVLVAALALALALTGLAACDATDSITGEPDAAPAPSSSPPAPKVKLAAAHKDGLAIDQGLVFTAQQGTLRNLKVSSPEGPLQGEVGPDGTSWTATGRLEPGTTYTASGSAERSDGSTQKVHASATTRDLTLDQQTFPSVAPLQGETVGVGMPVVVTFDIPVTNKAAFEKHMEVTSTPAQPGAWHWLSDQEAHWRPRSYWKAGTDVTVDVDINSVPAGGGVYGQESRQVAFHVGDAVISKVNAQTHQMQTFINGQLAKTTPITTGKAGFTTRSGVKVIMEKFRSRRMNSETIGIANDSSEGYDLDNVEYAMRVTYSGEFLHAAPWSVGSQGYANVSHGCTGMSTANAKWLYDRSKRGDVVEYTGTDRPMTLDNGYGDWNASYADWKAGSALS
ncbi:Ig-like domain-containing protein [Nocardioides sp. LHG3406-4]|uniref:L,D-transpeptidase n=1 Tax=Nocardioides sp. LHG3406-4 TaxID=2804575 RepID=UPI003CF9D2BE